MPCQGLTSTYTMADCCLAVWLCDARISPFLDHIPNHGAMPGPCLANTRCLCALTKTECHVSRPVPCAVAMLSQQLLLSAKQQLEAVVHDKLEEAVAARDHAAVLRFVLLHQPLAIPDKGISRCEEAFLV